MNSCFNHPQPPPPPVLRIRIRKNIRIHDVQNVKKKLPTELLNKRDIKKFPYLFLVSSSSYIKLTNKRRIFVENLILLKKSVNITGIRIHFFSVRIQIWIRIKMKWILSTAPPLSLILLNNPTSPYPFYIPLTFYLPLFLPFLYLFQQVLLIC